MGIINILAVGNSNWINITHCHFEQRWKADPALLRVRNGLRKINEFVYNMNPIGNFPISLVNPASWDTLIVLIRYNFHVASNTGYQFQNFPHLIS